MNKVVDIKLFWVDYYYPNAKGNTCKSFLVAETGRKTAENACRELNEPDVINISSITPLGKVGQVQA